MSLIALILVALLVVACGGDGGDDDGATLTDTRWVLAEADGAPAATEAEATITFSGDGVAGSTGCNSFSGSYSADVDGSLTIGPELATTRRACVDSLMAQEVAFLEAVTAVDGYEIEGSTLTLQSGSMPLLVFTAG